MVSRKNQQAFRRHRHRATSSARSARARRAGRRSRHGSAVVPPTRFPARLDWRDRAFPRSFRTVEPERGTPAAVDPRAIAHRAGWATTDPAPGVLTICYPCSHGGAWAQARYARRSLRDPEGERRHEFVDGVIEPRGATRRTWRSSVQGLRVRGPVPSTMAAARPADGGSRPKWTSTSTPRTRSVPTFRLATRACARRPSGALVTTRPDWVCEIPLDESPHGSGQEEARLPSARGASLLDPRSGGDAERLSVDRRAYLEVLIAERGEEVRPEPFDAIAVRVNALFGDDEEGG